ncbi:MAG: hypothetical protein ABFS56_21140 [Pseudomonadota bacterium]
MYKEYQANRGIQNLLLSVLLGAGENDYGAKTSGAVQDFLIDHAHGILRDAAIAKFDRLGLLGSGNVSLLPSRYDVAGFAIDVFKDYYQRMPNANKDIVLLIDVGKTASLGLLAGVNAIKLSRQIRPARYPKHGRSL